MEHMIFFPFASFKYQYFTVNEILFPSVLTSSNSPVFFSLNLEPLIREFS